MWPWLWLWWWPVMSHRPKADCNHAHKRVEAAVTEFAEKRKEKEDVDREARHAARNIRMLLTGVLERLERRDET
jgi:hypothetical protein